MPKPEQFNINGQLLTANAQDWHWNNLGYWADSADYGQACQALARLHGQAAQLQAGQHILELACGYGAAFELWKNTFNINKISALEYRPQCVSHIKHHGLTSAIYVGRFDYPLPSPLNATTYDAVLCVDAAYHAQSLAQFLAVITPALKSGGRFAFSTLILADDYASFPLNKRIIAQSLLRLANISQASVLSAAQIKHLAAQQQFSDLTIQPLNQPVFLGFADWVTHRAAQLSFKDKIHADWQKIYLTAQWCRWLANNPLLSYVLISGHLQHSEN